MVNENLMSKKSNGPGFFGKIAQGISSLFTFLKKNSKDMDKGETEQMNYKNDTKLEKCSDDKKSVKKEMKCDNNLFSNDKLSTSNFNSNLISTSSPVSSNQISSKSIIYKSNYSDLFKKI